MDFPCKHRFSFKDEITEPTRYCLDCGFVMKNDEFTYRIKESPDGSVEVICLDLGPARNGCPIGV